MVANPKPLKNFVVATLCYVYYKYQRTCDVIAPNAPSQQVGYFAHGTCIYRSESGCSI